jgi:hypothetical protein
MVKPIPLMQPLSQRAWLRKIEAIAGAIFARQFLEKKLIIKP